MSVTVEEIHSALHFGKIIRLRGVQAWVGTDDKGNYIDLHVSSENTLNDNQIDRNELTQG